MRSPDDLTVAFRQRGLKITPQRVAIFRALHGNPTHPTAESVYAGVAESMPSISLRTVYQTLNDLTEMGEIQPLCIGAGATRFDPNVDEHHHLVCDRCATIVDVHLDVSGLSPDEATGFHVDSASVVFHGRCPQCAGEPVAPA